MKTAGVVLLIFGLLRMAAALSPAGEMTPDDFQLVATLIAGGLIVLSLQQIRGVLSETQDIARSILEIEAAEDEPLNSAKPD